MSKFPQNIGRVLTLLYTKPGDTVLDPFAGHNSRMSLCVNLGRHYIGYDISHHFMEFNYKIRDALLTKVDINIELYEADSRHLLYTYDHAADFTITSPPYYDLEIYGDEPEQLGNLPTYERFLHDIGLIINENYRCLKHKAFCVWFVNDFRRAGRFHLYHIDILNLLQKAGFIPWDILIVDFGTAMRSAFASQIIESQIIPKKHEYALVVRKL